MPALVSCTRARRARARCTLADKLRGKRGAPHPHPAALPLCFYRRALALQYKPISKALALKLERGTSSVASC